MMYLSSKSLRGLLSGPATASMGADPQNSGQCYNFYSKMNYNNLIKELSWQPRCNG